MFGRKHVTCSEDEFNRCSPPVDEDDIDDEEEEEEDEEDDTAPPNTLLLHHRAPVPQPPPFYESVRAFAPSHMHISCHYDIPYPPHLIPPPVCGVSTFTYTRDFAPPPPHTFFGNISPNEELYCPQKSDNHAQVAKFTAPIATNPTHNEIVGEIYCTVPGRTSLLSSTTKYRVTVAEIQRRISAPECLNASLLGGILRKAKSKDGGKTLRDSLKTLGLTLPAGRRKQANVTAWTALVEEEAVHMAKDFAIVCDKEFHARDIGIYLTKTGLTIDPDVVKRRNALEHSRKIISELSELLACDRTPLTPFIPRSVGIHLEPSIQQHLSHFTLMTHGFGNVAMSAVLESVKSMIDESIKYIDRCCQQQHWR